MRAKAFKLLAVAAFLNVALWTLILIKFDRSNPAAVLHYSVDVGIDYIGEGGRVITLPIIGLCMLVLNSLLGWRLFKTEPRVAWQLWAVTPLLQLLLLLSAALLITVNP